MTFYTSQPEHKAGEICFICSPNKDKGGRLVVKVRKTGGKNSYSLICSRFPDCKNRVSAAHTKENSRNNNRKTRYMNNRFNKIW